ncbi:Protein of unknown function [Cotesia congregata]|uniref:Uncharacterized protein n=1 Tax=Cotesia congregata TaxID=51543 RepID=A0A8J2H6S1_COTCN|nr:Protein of unknown function [Cotesia congregata]
MSEQSINETVEDKEEGKRQAETKSESGESRGGEGEPVFEEGLEDGEGSGGIDRRGKGRLKKAESWKILRTSSLGNLGDIRGWVNTSKRKVTEEGEDRDTKIRAVGNKKEEGIEKLIENGFKKIIERLDEEKRERNKQIEEMRKETRLLEERMARKTQELELKLDKLKIEVQAGWEASMTKEGVEKENTKIKENKIEKEMKEKIEQIREELHKGKDKDKGTNEDEDRLWELEKWKENKEKEERKNNVMIFGWNVEGKIDKEKVTQFIKSEIEVESAVDDIEEVRSRGEGEKKMVWIRMKNWEKKKEIMENKSKLKGKKVFIENDRTKKEREEQKELNRRARWAKAEGAKEVKLGFGRLWVDGEWKVWDSKRKILVGTTGGRESKE